MARIKELQIGFIKDHLGFIFYKIKYTNLGFYIPQ